MSESAEDAELRRLRDECHGWLLQGDFDRAGALIAKAVPILLQHEVDTVTVAGPPEPAAISDSDGTAALHVHQPREDGGGEHTNEAIDGRDEDDASSSDGESDSSESSDDSGDERPITSYRYRSSMRLPRNPRLDHLCVWLYETIVHPESEDEPEEVSCQKLPAAVMAAWRLLQQLQQQRAAAAAAAAPDPDPTASDPSGSSPEQPGGPASASKESSTPAGMAPTARPCGGQGAGAGPRALSCWPTPPPTELLHMQHSAFSAPFCTWRHVGPDELPPLHDVLVGVLRVCWERHDDREPSRNVIWGAQSHSRKEDPVTAYLYVEYVRLLVVAIVASGAEPLWLWHELQEVIEEYAHWRHHPHEVAVLARMMVEYGCGWRLLNSLLDHIGKGPMLMYGAWAALWDGLRKAEARGCVRHAVKHGVTAEEVWVHVTELTLLQVKEHPRDAKLLTRAEQVLQRALSLTPSPAELEALLVAERDALGGCEGVREVISRLNLRPEQGLAAPAAADPASAGTG